ncbi:cell division ATP-binding protein FtsE [Anaerosolibacter sp.]|uniref:cell division ATP-binding protein FtsE n=1 Tax=Anaerosolibacter sp. TaxID=1872527 RepID=UPI0039F0CAF2
MIEAQGVCLKYGDGTVALNDVDLQIDYGEMVYITGPSGSGKTSLLKLLMAVEYPTSGSLRVLGQCMKPNHEIDIQRLRRRIGPVFQEFKLIKGRSAMENVMLGMRFLDIHPNKMKEDAYHALVKVGLAHKLSASVENLSWGESQRVAIARAIARKPALILADEPTGNLDTDNALNILELLASLKDEQTSVVITTHATHLIDDRNLDKLIQVDGGRVCCERLG